MNYSHLIFEVSFSSRKALKDYTNKMLGKFLVQCSMKKIKISAFLFWKMRVKFD